VNLSSLFKQPDVVVQGKPFLRWTGGKNWLIPTIKKIVNKVEFNNYHEPFIGGGSVFFSLKTNKKSFISDSNNELINCYKAVKKNPKKILKILSRYKQTEEQYYSLRNEKNGNEFIKAARFIHLNKTSFNGIYRVNLKGEYNVPYGKKNYDFNLLSKLIHSASQQLKNTNVNNSDFNESISNICQGDLVYLDPPYTITHNNNGFVKYNEKLFSYDDQLQLSKFIREIRSKGAYYILSNAHHPEVEKIYNQFNDNVYSLTRGSVIGGSLKSRGKYEEYLFTNII
jgi:DNA adenine methylase